MTPTSVCKFSPDRKYRYTLWRDIRWHDPVDEPKILVFIGLNPSTADESQDDPTIRRCKGFARDWGFDKLLMLNIFAFRSTDPKQLYREQDPVGRHNDEEIARSIKLATQVIAAWGVHGVLHHRGEAVRRQHSSRLWHLGLTKAGHPKHPLYLRADTKPMLWA